MTIGIATVGTIAARIAARMIAQLEASEPT